MSRAARPLLALARQAVCQHKLGRTRCFGPVARDLNKTLSIFPGLFEFIQTLEIHISLFVAPKIMKLVLLDL
jgi:hypothetical protein